MSVEKSVRMANNIAAFFKSQPEKERAVGVANHINRFWEARMRRELFKAVESGAPLDPLVLMAAGEINKPE